MVLFTCFFTKFNFETSKRSSVLLRTTVVPPIDFEKKSENTDMVLLSTQFKLTNLSHQE